MDTLLGNYFYENEQIIPCSERGYQINPALYRFYEVVRVIQGIPIFLEDHISRLRRSAKRKGKCAEEIDYKIHEMLRKLIIQNENMEGNIKILCSSQKEAYRFSAYYFPHRYPDPIDYECGVKLMLSHINRPDPNLKQVMISEAIRKSIHSLLVEENAYEVLLVNEQNIVTEGSKTNYFMIRDGILLTPPDGMVLKGITRNYILKIAREIGIKYRFVKIRPEDLKQCQAAFICGTSAKVLPVREINGIPFHVKENIMHKIMKHYDKLISAYIQSRTFS